ncbi:MAG: hypothetical protein ACP5UZ_08925 [Thermoplasmata archaeon]
MNYLIPDNKEIHKAVRDKVDRENWYNDVYRISKYALGETMNRIMTFPYSKKITLDFVVSRMKRIRDLIGQKRISVFSIEDIKGEWQKHLTELKNRDSFVEIDDIFILSFFCADPEANAFYTTDTHIIDSKGINDYMKRNEKKIEEISI